LYFTVDGILLMALTWLGDRAGLSTLGFSVDFITCPVDFFLSLTVQFLGVGAAI